MHLERIKVAIAVQELKSPLDDECRNETVYSFAHCDPLRRSARQFSALLMAISVPPT